MPPPVADTAVHYPQHSNAAGTLGQEVGEAGPQGWGQFMLGQVPQTLLSCPAPAFQLSQVLSQQLKVHLEKQGYTGCSPHRTVPPEAASAKLVSLGCRDMDEIWPLPSKSSPSNAGDRQVYLIQ